MQKQMYNYNMPMTLEKHFENLAQLYPAVQDLYSLWTLLKRQLEEKLIYSCSVFVNYSNHDKRHCLSIIQSIERFLGEERIVKLSATDTFMLLVCIYAHDYGMAQTYNKIYEVLGSREFEKFVEERESDGRSMEKEDETAVHNLFQYLHKKREDVSLKDLYFSIMLVVQLYLRPMHWEGIEEIKKDFYGLFKGNMKKRFIYGEEGIVEICMCHGQSVRDLLKMSYCADGMVGDEFHPRFVAALLRFGDLLDLDNGRFPMWFTDEIAKNTSVIPKLSILHFSKHESISHLLITPEKIEITAHCNTKKIPLENAENKQRSEFEREKEQQNSYDVATLIHDWTSQLSKECNELFLYWNEIAQADFGYPPAEVETKIYVDGKIYMAENKSFQMKMSQERVMKLLEGTNIYKDKYVGIREMIQNAVDASLLQLWTDLIQNKYTSRGLSKAEATQGFSFLDALDKNNSFIFNNYDITVEVIEDRLREQVIVVVKDKGIGINKEDVGYIADIGSSKEKNDRIRRITEKMPAWLKPSGIFGIGLQSLFQLTDCIEFYTRQHNQPEHQILLYSYGRNQGKIEIREIAESDDELYYDNAVPGTNVKIVISPKKIFGNKVGQSNFMFCDPEFDTGEDLHMIFEEIVKVCKSKIDECEYDYFNIKYDVISIDENGRKKDMQEYKAEKGNVQNHEQENKIASRYLRTSFMTSKCIQRAKDNNSPYIFKGKDTVYYWDQDTYRFYTLTLRPCEIAVLNNGMRKVTLPEKDSSLYNISYKFNKLSNTEEIYERHNASGHRHAGFLKLDVLIMDDKPMDYMNIDRDRLRAGAIDEEELIVIRERILQEWCRYFCDTKVKFEINFAYDRGNEELGILISLILTFYRNVSSEMFDIFKSLFIQSLDIWNKIVLDDTNPKNEGDDCAGVGISELWEREGLFQTENPVQYSDQLGENISKKLGIKYDIIGSGEERLRIDRESIIRLPHRLIKIEAIWQGYSRDTIVYDFYIRTFDMNPRKIEMDENARLYDYIGVLRMNGKIDFQSLPNKVFKPDKQYGNLIVPCFPHTFSKGENLQSELDYCITWYILSPFGKESAQKLQELLYSKVKDAYSLINAIEKENQFKNCVAYILKKRFPDCSNMKEQEEIIKNEYKAFLKHFYELLRNFYFV